MNNSDALGRWRWAASAIALGATLAACSSALPATHASTPPATHASTRSTAEAPPPAVRSSSASSAPVATGATGVHREIVFGHSVQGRPLTAVELGDPTLPAVLVVGCIHGNEPAGTAVVDRLLATPATAKLHLWLVRTMNPDGQAATTRVNADGVDLNRNFPGAWQPLDRRGGQHYSGPRSLSEPEARAMAALLQRIHPVVGVWFHQALNVIDISQGPRAVEDRLASQLGVREQALTDYPGSAIGWEDQLFPRSAFAFELPSGALTPARSTAIATAIVSAGRRLAASAQ